MALAVSADATINVKWSCPACTFEQSGLNDECQICGEKNKNPIKPPNDNNNKNMKDNVSNSIKNTKYGEIIYQIERFSDDQLKSTYSLYLKNPNLSTSDWCVYLFGDNDIDKSRPNGSDREMIGGLAGVAGKYDRSIAYGVVTTFYAYKPMPNFLKFREIINDEFNELYNKYIINGHNLIIPTPNNTDLQQHFSSFYENIDNDSLYQQVIFHNIGTGIARLPLIYLKYIQYKIDYLAKLSYQHNQEIDGQILPNDNKLIDNKPQPLQNEYKNDEKEEKEKEIEFSANDPIQVCVNPDIDIWADAVFLGYSDHSKKKCFLEIIKKNKENHFMEMECKYIRFRAAEEEKKEIEIVGIDNNHNKNKNKNNKNIQKDEWENVDDFVLKEYIRDVFDEISGDLLNSLDEFMRRMQFLGVYSAASRSRALIILEKMKNEKESAKLIKEIEEKEKSDNLMYQNQMNAQNDEFLAAEIAQKLADGHTLETFQCIRCHQKQEFGGIELRNCSHKICYKCFPQIISNHISMKMVPTCISCGTTIHQTDIKVHVNNHTADIVGDMTFKEMMSKQKDLHKCFDQNCDGCIIIEDKYMKEWRCPVCNERNCIKCKKIHKGTEQCYVPPPPKPIRPIRPYNRYNNKNQPKYNYNGNYHISNEEFFSNWVNIQDIKYSNMIQSFDVPFECDEWNKVILHIRDPNKRKVERIERIQHAKIWRSYWGYCNKLKSKKGSKVKEGGFWHGTRTCAPSKIWKQKGFDKNHARIGGCLWYATENTYSMGGFQHVRSDGKHQVFLAFVATGNRNDCKFIRSDKILNVYKNEATYPAYLLTYKNI